MKWLSKKVLAEEYHLVCKQSHRSDETDFIKTCCLYEIEFEFLVFKVGTRNIRIFDYDNLDSGGKLVYVLNKDTNMCVSIYIPKLVITYVKNDVYNYCIFYHWKNLKNDKVRIVKTDNNLYNRHAHRYYEIGDVNKYNEELIKIEKKNIVAFSHRVPKYVCLKFFD